VLRLTAAAKVNLTLEVLARRGDGYHGVRSLIVPIGLYDEIAISPSERPAFACDDARVGAGNSVVAALAALDHAPANVSLTKRIPIGAGLGGGSSDAAAILRAAMRDELAVPDVPRDWLAIARSLGSDVPFFLTGTGALVEATGERVTAVGALPPWWVVVAAPPVAVDTAEAYRLLDDGRAGGAPQRARSTSASLAALEALQRADFDALCGALVNDFEPVVLGAYPAAARAHAALGEAAGSRALLTGSGACSFALFRNEDAARAAAARLDPAVATAYPAPLLADGDWR
jgi:4-diphosphocytidyl-2-C-methyl-D-erythritol kinase